MCPAPAPNDSFVGPYRLVEKIGHGGQGDVVQAEDTRSGQLVALKLLTQRAAMLRKSIGRFGREAVITWKLSHPGSGPIYEVGMDGEVPFIAMKLIAGETLAPRITTARDGARSTCVILPQTGVAAPSPTVARTTATPGRA